MTTIYVNPDNYCQCAVVNDTEDNSILICNMIEPMYDGQNFILVEGMWCDAIYFANYSCNAVNTPSWKTLLEEADVYERHMENMADTYFDNLYG